ncbi:MAG: hypothetical protein RLN70_07915, partial [Rhodospirillaceae bacterium]
SEAFRMALTVYKDHGAGRMAIITERNLTRAEKQIETASEKRIADPVWAQSFNITDDDSSFDWGSFLEGTDGDSEEGPPSTTISEVA